jgi:hypothetical protein
MIISLTLTFSFISLTQVSQKGRDLHDLSLVFNNLCQLHLVKEKIQIIDWYILLCTHKSGGTYWGFRIRSCIYASNLFECVKFPASCSNPSVEELVLAVDIVQGLPPYSSFC